MAYNELYMDKKLSERRQIENEVVFRQANEQIQKRLDKLTEMAKEEGYTSLPDKPAQPLQFYCECSDENCKERIALKLDMYNDLHNNRKQFLIKPDHEVASIERIVLKDSNYTVVEKFTKPPEKATQLWRTHIVNA